MDKLGVFYKIKNTILSNINAQCVLKDVGKWAFESC